MRNVMVKERQTVFDIAVQEMGAVDAAFDLARLNDLSVSAILKSGQVLKLPNDPADVAVVNEYKIKGWKPATGDLPGDNIQGGIGYMGIGIDFKVS